MGVILLLGVAILVAMGNSLEPGKANHISIAYGTLFRPITHQLVPTTSAHALYFRIVTPAKPVLPPIPWFNISYCNAIGIQQRPRLTRPQILKYANFTAEKLKMIARQDNKTETLLIGRLESCLRNVAFVQQFKKRYDSFRRSISHEFQSINDFLSDRVEPTRKKRAILSFLNPVYTDLFGLATQDSVLQLQDNLKNLLSNQQNIANSSRMNLEAILTLANSSNQRLTNLFDAVSVLSNQANNTQTLLKSVIADTNRELSKHDHYIADVYAAMKVTEVLSNNAHILLLDCQRVQRSLNEWKLAMIALSKSMLPAELISHADMINALKQAESKIRLHYPEFQLLHDSGDSRYYFLTPSVNAFVHDVGPKRELIIHVTLPLSTRKQSFDIYQVDYTPVPLVGLNSSKPGIGYTVLDQSKLPAFYVTSQDLQFHTHLTATQFQYCVTRHDKLCPLLAATMDAQITTCLSALFHNDNEQISTLCPFIVYPMAMLPDRILYAGNSVYLVSSPDSKFTIQCKNKARETHTGLLAIVTLPCSCAVSTSTFLLPPTLEMCSNTVTEIVVKFPVNAIQWQLTGLARPHESWLSETPKLTYATDVPIALDFSRYKKLDRSYEIDVGNALLQGASHTIHLKGIKDLPKSSWIDIQAFLPLLDLILVIIALVILTLFMFKCYVIYRQFLPVLLILSNQLPKPANALQTREESQQASTYTAPGQFDIQMFASHVLIIILMFITYKAIVHSLHDRHSDMTKPKLLTTFQFVISDLHEISIIDICVLPICSQRVTVQAIPGINSILVEDKLIGRPTVKISWDGPFNFKLANSVFLVNGQKQVSMPKRLSVLLQRHMYDDQNTDNILFTGYRMQCTCGCLRNKHLVHQFTPKCVQISSDITEITSDASEVI